jgi:hypothetical protein
MTKVKLKHPILWLAGLLIALSSLALIVNHFLYHYPGNNYFPNNILLIILIPYFFYLGVTLSCKKDSYMTKVSKELLYFIAVMSVIALASNAVQLTPFEPIDRYIFQFELKFNVNLNHIVAWTNQHPHFKLLLRYIYDSLPYQMGFIPLAVIALGRFHLIREYYFLMLFSALIGFSFYYFCPTTAPASILDSSLFSVYQIATGLKFAEIHHHIPPSTNEGGLIALPSFHAIWAIFCTYLLKEWPIVCFPVGLLNLLLIISCVLLGWHYPLDIIAGILLAYLSFWLKNKTCDN